MGTHCGALGLTARGECLLVWERLIQGGGETERDGVVAQHKVGAFVLELDLDVGHLRLEVAHPDLDLGLQPRELHDLGGNAGEQGVLLHCGAGDRQVATAAAAAAAAAALALC